jgi:hypothetical protein
MMPMRKTLFSLAIHDEAMFYTFLQHYAASYNIRFKTRDTSEVTYYNTTAARLVNERLSDPSLALSNEMVGTVANLASYEVSNSHMLHWDIILTTQS